MRISHRHLTRFWGANIVSGPRKNGAAKAEARRNGKASVRGLVRRIEAADRRAEARS